ncbi:LOW QUALITY PROTEIN: hypothetical protein PoB_005180700 [Plakobranchus ocellatus]|uniref:Uncharacterized protein n=1 Tax=Plakobranchus ocellatus TaxID=259542 RepID=A0AAV4C134_9GAST|nr:LOW QUALITY PROTEIN: hypothetical protein PoB_005180700 [Plakobranchus ocellatus]
MEGLRARLHGENHYGLPRRCKKGEEEGERQDYLRRGDHSVKLLCFHAQPSLVWPSRHDPLYSGKTISGVANTPSRSSVFRQDDLSWCGDHAVKILCFHARPSLMWRSRCQILCFHARPSLVWRSRRHDPLFSCTTISGETITPSRSSVFMHDHRTTISGVAIRRQDPLFSCTTISGVAIHHQDPLFSCTTIFGETITPSRSSVFMHDHLWCGDTPSRSSVFMHDHLWCGDTPSRSSVFMQDYICRFNTFVKHYKVKWIPRLVQTSGNQE